MTIAFTRRAFIRASPSAAGGLAIAVFAPAFAGAAQIFGEPAGSDSAIGPEVNAFVVIDPDNSITLRVAKSEMGQGVLTSLAMILAEELECDFAKVLSNTPPPTATSSTMTSTSRWEPAAPRRCAGRASSCNRRAPRLGSG